MKKIFAIAWKDTLVRFSGRSEWIFFLVLPIVFTLVLAGVTGRSASTRVHLVVVDQAHSPLSTDLIDALQKSEAVRPDLQSLDAAESQLSRQKISTLLVIPPDFDLQHLEQGHVQLELRTLPNRLDAIMAERAVQAAILPLSGLVDLTRNSLSMAEQIKPFASAAERQSFIQQAYQEAKAKLEQSPERLQVTNSNTINYDDSRANSSAGQLITWVFVPLLGISSLFVSERQGGTLRRLLTTPTHKATYLFGAITGQVATAMVQMLLLVGFGMIVLKVNWGRDPAALAVILISTALAGAALGTTLGTFVKTEGQAGSLSILAGMVMALLGGCWFPLELFPQMIRKAVNVLPTTWAMQGMIDIVLGGQGLGTVLPIAGVLLAFAIVFFGVGIWRFRYE